MRAFRTKILTKLREKLNILDSVVLRLRHCWARRSASVFVFQKVRFRLTYSFVFFYENETVNVRHNFIQILLHIVQWMALKNIFSLRSSALRKGDSRGLVELESSLWMDYPDQM